MIEKEAELKKRQLEEEEKIKPERIRKQVYDELSDISKKKELLGYYFICK